MSGLWRNFSFLTMALLSLSQVSCLKKPSSEVSSQDFPLTLSGRVLGSDGLGAGDVGIYMETEEIEEARTAADGSFSFAIDADRMQLFRGRYAPLDQPLHLYFVKSGVPGESAVYDQIQPIAIGLLDIGTIRLEKQVAVSGQVRAAKKLEQSTLPVEKAYVRVGRNASLTDADGMFALYAPMRSHLPILISQKGYVQTQGTWHVGVVGDARNFVLYDRLTVEGTLDVPSSFRDNDKAMKTLTLALSANILARWVRLALSDSELAEPVDPRITWQMVEGSVEIPLNAARPQAVYYQFADKDRKILSPVYRLDLDFSRFAAENQAEAAAAQEAAAVKNETISP